MKPRHVLLAATALLVAVVLTGPVLAGDAALRTVAPPWSPPGPDLPLGADALGRDVLARVLTGGRELALTAGLSALTATTVGAALGVWAGWSRSRAAPVLTAAADLLLVLPLLLVALVAAVALPGPWAVVVGTVLGGSPLTLRVVADATRNARYTGYVEAAVGRGEPTATVLLREVLPAHAGLLGADLGVRTVLAVQLAAALAVLGYGPAPPAADWAVMLRENLPGMALNPAAVLAPAAALTLLTVVVAVAAQRLGQGRR
ncbi:MAG: ABC transporter permease subunit [Pseudonocardia sp.]|nr:ABC transporter permease subunit [Pseudonocardia sp.]